MREVLKGKDIVLGQDMSNYIKEPLRTPLRLDQARNQLSSAKGRLYHALFWFVDSNKVDHAALYYLTKGQQDKAEQILQSQDSFSSFINLAVIRLLEERYDEAMELYKRCFQNEDYTQAFVNAIIGERYKIKGIFMLSKVMDELKKAKERKERDDNADERSFAGAGAGMVFKATSGSHLVHPRTKVTSIESMRRLRTIQNFDRHLYDSLSQLLDRIEAINDEYNISNDFGEMDLNPNIGALMVIDEIDHYLVVNNSLIDAFSQYCVESRQRELFVAYMKEFVSIVQGTFNLYVGELGRQLTPNLIQRIRSLNAKIARIYFRYKNQDIDMMIQDLRLIEDVLPYYHELSQNFESNIAVNDDELLVKNFYKFHASSIIILNRFAKTLGLIGPYSHFGIVLQDMVVRFNITYISVLTNLALKHPESDYQKARARHIALEKNAVEAKFAYESNDAEGNTNQEEVKAIENKSQDPEHNEENAPEAQNYPVAETSRNLPTAQEMAERYRSNNFVEGKFDKRPENKAEAKAQAKLNKTMDKMRLSREKKRKAFFKRRITKERSKFLKTIDSFNQFTVFTNTGYLIEVTKEQLDRLAPPVTTKSIVLMVVLAALAGGAVYLNYHVESFLQLIEEVKSRFS